jgi:hypothetical protein
MAEQVSADLHGVTTMRAHQHAAGGKGRRSFRPLAVPTAVRLKVKQNQLVAGVK